MTDFQHWQETNARQLSEALAWLRQRLESLAAPRRAARTPAPSPIAPVAPVTPSASMPSPPTIDVTSRTVPRSLLQRLLGGSSAETQNTAPPTEAAPASASKPDAAVAEVVAGPPEFPLALTMLGKRLGLSSFEQQLLLLCAGMELDTRIPAHCAQAQDDPQKAFPTFALALALFDDPAWEALSPERPLRYFRLLDIHQPGAQCLTTSPLRADERIVNYLKGLNYLDDRLTPLLSPMPSETQPDDLSPSQAEVAEGILRRLKQTPANTQWPIVQLLGSDPVGKFLVARGVAAQIGRAIYRLPVEALPAAPADLETLARLWHRESLLLPLALYLDAQELDGPATDKLSAALRFTGRSDGVFFLGIREAAPQFSGSASLAFDVVKPTAEEQQAAWKEALGPAAGETPALLAGQFNLNLSTLRQIARRVRSDAGDVPDPLVRAAWDACCASERPRLDALAQRLEPKVAWDDLVLPDYELKLLKQIGAQVRQRRTVYGEWGFARRMNRGLGISALFAGPSGTGKTMAAEVLAHDLRLNLYRIDLSQVVNKYIGETEKNLRRLFDAAENGGAILFFDEADALFGKRSEVKDSHDRYANIEINYLLQRMEAFRGLAILATNMKTALDAAFLRRLRFVVNFPFPSLADRRRLWQNVFPRSDDQRRLVGTPVADLDYDRLARLNLCGGHIHNVALNAAFLAAQAGTPVTMPLVLEAARAELLKLERPASASEFKWTDGPLRTRINHLPALEAAQI